MTTVNCSNNEELDFRLFFGEDARQHSQGPAGQGCDDGVPYITTQSLVNQPTGQELQGHHMSPPTPASFQTPNNYQNQGYQVQASQYSSMGYPRAFDCPSIQITSIAPNSHPEAGGCGQDAVVVRGAEGERSDQTWSRDHLYLSLDPCYRDATLSASPCSSLSSRSWLSDVSSCESFSHIYDDVEAELNEAAARVTLSSPLTSPLPSPGCGGGAFGVEIWQQQYQHPLGFTQALSPHQSPRQSPCHSPRHSPRNSITDENWLNPRPTSRSSSRPTSPCGKRRHSSADVHARSPSPHRSPSPTPGHSPRGSVTEDSLVGSLAGALGPLLYGYPELDVPSKTRRTSGTQLGLLPGQGDSGLEDLGAVLPFLDSPGDECVNQDGLAELFLSVPSHFSWNKPKPGNAPLFRSSSLPPLDWPLPSQYGQYELKIEVQPRGHHRAHYETEGSRGSIKAVSGGHPVIKLIGYTDQPVNMQVFIGTSDDRFLRPHAFYQVHRVTGKTVSTACQENIVGGTKVLEIPLLPENSMSTSIDCAGILKLRNSDIELRKGETDIGRKNTRVRVVFRVNIPQTDGKTLCLQTASIPVECSQRSAQDLPQVEKFSPASCHIDGGEKMLITGSSISPESKVIFLEKGPDGRTQWEVDAKLVPNKSSESSIVVEIPPYHNKKATSTVQVQFYVSNGKRKRSQSQSFTYLIGRTHHFISVGDPTVVAPRVKQEHCDLDYTAHNPPGLYQTTTLLTSPDQPFCLDMSFYDSSGLPVPCAPSQPAYSPLGSSPLQHPPHLQGNSPNTGRQRIHAMQMADPSRTLPSSQAAQHRVPYNNQSNSPVRSAAATLANHTVPAQSNMAAPKSTEKLMYQSPIRADLCQHVSQSTSSQIRAPASIQFPSLGYHSSFSGSDHAVSQAEQGLSYQHSRDAPDSYSSTPQTSSVPPHASTGGPPRQQAMSLGPRGAIVPSVDPQKHPSAPHSLFSSTGEMVKVKQEPEEKLSLGSMGLQEITLDDVNEIIDRDISQLGGGAELVQAGQDHYGWDQNSSDSALPFCGGPQ